MTSSSREGDVPGWGWLIGTSSWLLLPFIGPSVAWLGFLVVAIVSRRRAAWVIGAASGVLALTVLFELWGPFTGIVNAVTHLGGIVGALMLNPGWLRARWERRVAGGSATSSSRASSRSSKRSSDRSSSRDSRASNSGSRRTRSATKVAQLPEPVPIADALGATSSDLLQTRDAAEPIDVQTATADELADLPGLNRTTARRAVKVRTKNGGFVSVEDFGEAAGLQPHEIVRLRSAATCSPRPRGERRFGRRVDL